MILYKNINNFKKVYESFDDGSESDDNDFLEKMMGPYLIKRHISRINYFNKIKRINKLNFNDEAKNFINFLEFMFHEKAINYLYFMKKVCDLYNINIYYFSKINEKYEKIWNEFFQKG